MAARPERVRTRLGTIALRAADECVVVGYALKPSGSADPRRNDFRSVWIRCEQIKVRTNMPRSAPRSSLSFGQKLLVVAVVLLSPMYLLPLMFLVGAVTSLAIWDEVVAARKVQRGWFVAWIAGLVLVAIGACYTFFVLPRLPFI